MQTLAVANVHVRRGDQMSRIIKGSVRYFLGGTTMKHSTRYLISFILLGTILNPCATTAGPNANAKILLHVARVDKNPCGALAARPSCGSVVTSAQLYPHYYFVGLLVADAAVASGVGALECGISYDPAPGSGVDVIGWIRCADFDAPVAGANGPWPASGSGNQLSWNVPSNCQRFQPPATTSAVALAGYLYCAAYTPGTLDVVPAPGSHLALVSSCEAVLDTVEGGSIHPAPSHLGTVRFSTNGTEPGFNPCGLVTSIQGSSWSAIKGQMGHPRQ